MKKLVKNVERFVSDLDIFEMVMISCIVILVLCIIALIAILIYGLVTGNVSTESSSHTPMVHYINGKPYIW